MFNIGHWVVIYDVSYDLQMISKGLVRLASIDVEFLGTKWYFMNGQDYKFRFEVQIFS